MSRSDLVAIDNVGLKMFHEYSLLLREVKLLDLGAFFITSKTIYRKYEQTKCGKVDEDDFSSNVTMWYKLPSIIYYFTS